MIRFIQTGAIFFLVNLSWVHAEDSVIPSDSAASHQDSSESPCIKPDGIDGKFLFFGKGAATEEPSSDWEKIPALDSAPSRKYTEIGIVEAIGVGKNLTASAIMPELKKQASKMRASAIYRVQSNKFNTVGEAIYATYAGIIYPFIAGLIVILFYANRRIKVAHEPIEINQSEAIKIAYEKMNHVAHQFRAPLAGLKMACEELSQDPGNQELVSTMVRTFPAQVEKLFLLTTEISKSSRELSKRMR